VMPVVSGTAQVGQSLSASTGTWSGTTPITYSFQWQRCDSAGANCAAVAGATAASYSPTSSDGGSTMRASVTATNAASSASASSTQTAVVVAAPLVPSALGTSLPTRMPESSGTAIYVSLGGSDSNSGAVTSPFRTLNKAFSVASSGTTIYMRGGVYPDVAEMYNRTFSATNPLTITNYPGENVKITGNGSTINMLYFQNDVGVRVRGLELANGASTGVGLKVYNGNHFDLDRLFVHNNGVSHGQGILISGDNQTAGTGLTYSNDVQIWDSIFTANGADPVSDHSLYYGSGATPNGVRQGTLGGVIANNVVYDQTSGAAFHIGHEADGVILTNNTVYHSTSTNAYMGQSVTLWNEGSDGFETKNVKVVNNIFANSKVGVYGSGWGSMPSNIIDYNLAFANTSLDPDCAPDCNFNPQYGGVSLYSVGANNVTSLNPFFVNVASHDFHLQPASAALGRANPAYAPPLDADGKPRPAAPAVGAFG
jgi:hypothetical protein